MIDAKARWAARADRLIVWADAAEKKADALEANHNHDWAFVSQPGHLPARARQIAQTDRAMELRRKAADFRSKAATLRQMASRNAGDAEAARSTKRDALSTVAPGDYVESVYGFRRVLKVNAKTFRLEGALEPITIDKALCKLVAGHCGNCGSWKPPEPPHKDGECWSGDRLDGDLRKGPAGYALAHERCEAWIPARAA